MIQKHFKRFSLSIGALLLLAMVSASSAVATPFQVRTESATNVGAFTAKLNGSYYGQQESGASAFEYGTSESFGQETPLQMINPSGPGWISGSRVVSGLQPETTYYYRFGTVSYNGEVTMGKTFSFTTRSLPRLEAARYAAKVTAQQSSTNPMSLGVEGVNLACQDFGGTATMQAATTGLKLTPTFSNCSGFGVVTVNTNGCTQVLHPSDPGTATGSLDIVCPEGQSIVVQAGSCGFSIPAQTGLKTVEMRNVTTTSPTTVSVKYNVTNLTYVKTNDGFACPFNGTGTMTDGTLKGTQILSAVDSANVANDLKIGY